MNTFKILLCSFLLLIPCAVRAQGYNNPVDDKMPIVAWYSIESGHITKEEFKRLNKAGFNLSLSMSLSKGDIISSLQAAKGTGVKLIVQNRRINNYDESFISLIKEEETLGLYYLYDEPSVKAFPDLAELVQRMNNIDSLHMTYINLYPNDASNKLLGVDSYQSYIERYLNIVRPDFLSFDYYPFVHNMHKEGYFDNLELIYEACKAKGLVFWGFVKVLRDSQLSYVDEGMIRYQVYSNLAYGAQGIQYYTYSVPRGGKEAVIDTSYSRSNIYKVVSRVNKEIQRQSKYYLNAEFKSVVHSDTLQSEKSLASFKIKDLKTKDKGIVLTLFEKDGASYVLVVNKDYQNQQDITIDYMGKAAIINKNGKRKKLRQVHNFTIEAGDGVLFQLNHL